MRLTPAIAIAALLSTATLVPTIALAEPPRDPFAPFERASVAAGDAPLQRFPLEQLKLRGVLLTASPRALLESPDGASHVARVGDLVGTGWGRITAIGPGAITVAERYRDPIGGLHENRAELRLAVALLSAARAGRSAPEQVGGR